MKWEYIGAQQLPDRKGKISRTIRPEMWRARVPGGWLLLMSNSYDVKSPAFYPDPEHVWEVEVEEPQSPSRTLLRPAAEQNRLTDECVYCETYRAVSGCALLTGDVLLASSLHGDAP